MSAAEMIVRKLAGSDAPIADGTYANGHDWCTLCSGEGPEVKNHHAECPWRMAKEYAEAERILNEKIAYARSLPFSRLGLAIALWLYRRQSS